MGLSVRDVLNLEIMRESRVLCCEDMLAKSIVSSISVIELPVENFVRSSEFVLTTGMGIGQDTEQFKQFINDVATSKACAIGVATGRHIMEIPEDVLQRARDLQMPVIEIPWAVRFADIIQIVLAALHSEQQSLLQQSYAIQEELLTLVLNNAGLSALASFVESQIDTPLLITDRRGDIVGRSNGSRSLEGLWMDATHPEAASYPHPASTYSVWSIDPIVQGTGNLRFVKLPIRSASETQGYLVLSLPSETTLDTFLSFHRAHVLEQVAAAAALCFLRTNLMHQTEARLRHDFVLKLIKNEHSSSASVAAQADMLQYDLTQTYVCILCSVDNFQEIYEWEAPGTAIDTWIQRHMQRIEELVIHVGRLTNRTVISAIEQNQVIAFIQVYPDEEPVKCINAVIDELEEDLQHLLPGIARSSGISDTVEGLSSFHRGYQQAQSALEIGKRKGGRGNRTHFTDVGLYQALAKLSTDEQIQKLIQTSLGQLLKYDAQKEMDLCDTLRTYLHNQGNVSQTSRQLNLHRQTLVYRLHKIESLTGRSLTDPDNLFLLDFALRVRGFMPVE